MLISPKLKQNGDFHSEGTDNFTAPNSEYLLSSLTNNSIGSFFISSIVSFISGIDGISEYYKMADFLALLLLKV